MQPSNKGYHKDGEKQCDLGSSLQLGRVYCSRRLRAEVSLTSFLRGRDSPEQQETLPSIPCQENHIK